MAVSLPYRAGSTVYGRCYYCKTELSRHGGRWAVSVEDSIYVGGHETWLKRIPPLGELDDCEARRGNPCLNLLIEQVSPGPYLELFARTNRLGWDAWGNECLSTELPIHKPKCWACDDTKIMQRADQELGECTFCK